LIVSDNLVKIDYNFNNLNKITDSGIEMKGSFFEGKNIKVHLHLLAWAILLGLPIYFIKRWQVGNDFIWFYYINTFISGIIFYTNYFFLVPRSFFVNKRIRYYLSALILLICFYFVSDISNRLIFKYSADSGKTEQFDQKQAGQPGKIPPHREELVARPPSRDMHFFNYASTSLFLVFFSLGLRVLERQTHIEKMQKELEREKLNSELAFLKNQISPHFFFNTLNNIYSLISINQVDSQKAVLQLSKLMRYLLYESELGNTPLSSEINFMNNYIDLMKLRMNDKISLNISFPEKFEDMNIPPLLFIPFIENIFKHGISYRDKSNIDISMLVVKNSITFRCTNSLVNAREETDNGHSGIGLENASKRLNLLFPGKHDLKISRSDSAFEVLLYINFE
jgi:two-component system, LytTR family, sensor kinase